MKYKVLFLDWDGTLSTGLFWQHWQAERPEIYAALQKFLFVDNESLILDWMRGKFSAEQIIHRANQAINLPDDTIDQLAASCRHIRITNPLVMDLIQALRINGIRVVIATNNMDTFHRWTSPHLQLSGQFDEILDSWQLGFLKADATQHGQSAFFGPYLNRHGIAPQDCVLIDDTPTNASVEQFGIKPIIIERGQDISPILNQILHGG